MTQEEAVTVHELSKKSAIGVFKKKAFVDGIENYLKILKQKINN